MNQDLRNIDEVIEVEGILQFNLKKKEGYQLLAVSIHSDADSKGNVKSCTLFTMGRSSPTV